MMTKNKIANNTKNNNNSSKTIKANISNFSTLLTLCYLKKSSQPVISLAITIFLFIQTHIYADNYNLYDKKPKEQSKVMKKFFGGNAKIIWVDTKKGNHMDSFLEKSKNHLLGIDSSNKRGVVKLLEKQIAVRKPFISPNGKQVFFTDFDKKQIFVTDWGSGKAEKVTDGVCLFVTQNQKSKSTIVYIGRDLRMESFGIVSIGEVLRLDMDAPDKIESVWKITRVALDSFSVLPDNNKFVSVMPWPLIGMGDFAKQDWHLLARGCWPNAVNYKKEIYAILDGSHKNYLFFSTKPAKKWKVKLNNHKNLKRHEIYQPHLSNHPRFISLTGPYKKSKNQGTGIFSGSKHADVYIGRFSEDMSKVSDWLQVTKNKYGDFQPDVWVAEKNKFLFLKRKNKIDFDYQKVVDGKDDFEAYKRATTTNWPNLSSKGGNLQNSVIAFWKDFQSDNKYFNYERKVWLPLILDTKNLARPGANWQAKLSGGFANLRANEAFYIINKVQEAKNFSLELVLRTKNLTQENSVLCIIGTNGGKLFTIEQFQNSLHVKFFNGEQIISQAKFGFLSNGRSQHLLITCGENNSKKSKGEINCYLDGTRKETVKFDENPLKYWNLNNPEQTKIRFGADLAGDSDWQGEVRYIAIYKKNLNDTEIALGKKMQVIQELNDEKTIPPLTIKAKVLKTSPPPNTASLNEYPNSLSILSYKFQELISGTLPKNFDKAKPFAVAHWSVLDRKITSNKGKKTGAIVTLQVEPFFSHPELESQRWDNDIEDIDMDDQDDGNSQVEEINFFDISEPSY